MDTLITLVQNDYGYDLDFTLKDANNVIVDLTGASISFICQNISDTSVTFTGVMTSVSPSLGVCNYTVQVSDFKVSGPYKAQIAVNYGLGAEIVSWENININVVSKLPI